MYFIVPISQNIWADSKQVFLRTDTYICSKIFNKFLSTLFYVFFPNYHAKEITQSEFQKLLGKGDEIFRQS